MFKRELRVATVIGLSCLAGWQLGSNLAPARPARGAQVPAKAKAGAGAKAPQKPFKDGTYAGMWCTDGNQAGGPGLLVFRGGFGIVNARQHGNDKLIRIHCQVTDKATKTLVVDQVLGEVADHVGAGGGDTFHGSYRLPPGRYTLEVYAVDQEMPIERHRDGSTGPHKIAACVRQVEVF